jgi:hypothetical protein
LSPGGCALSGDARRVAFYALRPGGLRDCVTLLHPPYTAWHLSYVALGGALATRTDGARLTWTLVAFLLAVGVAAHCLDELNGRPLATHLPASALVTAATVSLAGAAAIGLWGVSSIGVYLVPFVVIGVGLVLAYNLEWFGGALHTDHVFALGWGAFPVLVGGFAQTGSIELPVMLGAAFAAATSLAQRALSNWARRLRRGGLRVEGFIERPGEARTVLDVDALTAPAELSLRALAAAHVLLAVALVALRFGWS